MNVEDYRAFCLSLNDEVEERMPFSAFKSAQSVLAFYICGHMFAYFDIDRFHIVSLKCQPERIDEMRAQETPGIGNPFNLSPKYWIGVDTGLVEQQLLCALTANSFEIVRKKYTPSQRRAAR